MNKLIAELTKAEAAPFDATTRSALADKMGELLAAMRRVLQDNTREHVALYLMQLVSNVAADYHEKRVGALEHENEALKDACGPKAQERIAKYEKEIADLQAAVEEAQLASVRGGGGVNSAEVEKLQNELTVLSAENMILRRKIAAQDSGKGDDVSPLVSSTAVLLQVRPTHSTIH